MSPNPHPQHSNIHIVKKTKIAVFVAWGKLRSSILVLIVENKFNKFGSLQNSFKQFYLFVCLCFSFFRVKASDIIQIHNTLRYLILILAGSLLCLVYSVSGNVMTYYYNQVISLKHHQIRSVTQSCPTLWDPMNCSTPGLPVHHQIPEYTQTHVHRVSDAIQPSHPLSSPSPPAPNPSQHQSLCQWVNSSHEVAKVLEFQL